ncbi:hypothetical protein C1H46_037658 [Malus baccata]|uniref:RNase H type-1 domain-containing protein n=1 Tax=Malus baccata TaxID=106549 RepID=A0A540KRG4_MALBA|nr:hypothetical protein C1H46_037658 [Malus baccata]
MRLSSDCDGYCDVSTNMSSSIRQLVEDTKSILGFLTHVRRQANTVAHRFARFGLKVSSQCVRFAQPPSFIIDLLVEDPM